MYDGDERLRPAILRVNFEAALLPRWEKEDGGERMRRSKGTRLLWLPGGGWPMIETRSLTHWSS